MLTFALEVKETTGSKYVLAHQKPQLRFILGAGVEDADCMVRLGYRLSATSLGAPLLLIFLCGTTAQLWPRPPHC
jgi:hypothetical protein